MENFHHHHHLHHHNHRHPSQFLHKPIPLLLNTSPALSSTSLQPSTSSSLMENFLASTTTNSPSSLITGHLNSQHQQQLAFDWHQHLTAAATAAAAAAMAAASSATVGSSGSSSNCYAAFAGSDINADSKVYLLYEMPMALLAKRFYDSTKITDKHKIMVSFFQIIRHQIWKKKFNWISVIIR